MAKLGERIREVRQRKGLSQSELARLSGVARSLITNVEAGRRTLSLANARDVARALGVSVDYLIGTFEPDERRATVA
jgi:transcriptional regulator with XRE-family HTH domain